MPSLLKNLNLSNLTQKNYNSMELTLWDIPNVSGVALNSLSVTQTGTSLTILWGDKTQNNTVQKSITVNHNY